MSAEQEQLLDDLLEKDNGLTAWELDFIESLDGQRERELSDKQDEALHRIARKVGLES